MGASEPIIRLESATKSFRTRLPHREVVAVDGVDLSVERGSVVAFVGPNGAGKTTTIYLLLGLLKPDRGRVFLFGEPAGSIEARRRVGFMSEIFHTYPFHTAQRALEFYGGLSGLATKDLGPRIRSLLARVGLGGAADRKVGTFSKGMSQRLGLAQALLHGPELLILDEPTTGLDPEGRRLVADLIAAEKARGTTVFLSSHILSDVERSCDSVAMIRDGAIVLSKSIAEPSAESDAWEVEARGVDEPLRRRLTAAGFPVVLEDDGMTVLSCSADTKKELLRLLVDAPVEIGQVRRVGESLEDLYLRVLGTRPGEG